jgi:FtsP/CotA-like multicopper oxidase with cupredoxin domain
MRPIVLAVLAAAAAGASVREPAPAAVTEAMPVVIANDNRVAAGTMENGVLTLRLVVAMARWYPESPDGAFTEIPVFAEEGKAPSIPGPLIRVPVGTRVRISIRNALGDSTLSLFGPIAPAATDSAPSKVQPGATHEAEFRAEVAGTFLYAARYGPMEGPAASEDEQLAGAIVVDAPGERTDDRVLVLNIWGSPQPDSSWREALAINGKGWPYTERFDLTVGDSVRWRVVNASVRVHPMHLHGAYFRVDGRGTGVTDTTYAAAQRRMVVTEVMAPRSTMRFTWSPEEPGNWLFHCHLAFHVIARARLDPPEDNRDAMLSHDPAQHMAGLVMGISVRPRAGQVEAARANARRLSAFVLPGIARDTTVPRPISLRLARESGLPAAASVRAPGDVIVLTRGEPTDITVHNRLAEATAIHWHGLELESWSDGVPGWSGAGARVAPSIAPNDSFVARLTLKRAGTFIYHTHLNDIEQLASGLYGALVVLEPGQRWDPARDFVFVGGWDVTGGDVAFVVNGGLSDPPVQMRVGEAVRLRFIDIGPADDFTFRMLRDSVPAEWRPVAKDGFELPASQSRVGPAIVKVDVGETYDVEFTPTVEGTYRLVSALGPGKRYERLYIVRRGER